MQHQRKTIISTRLSRSLALGSRLTALADALQDALTVLVELQLADDDLGGVDADGDALAVGLLADDTLDVDDVLKTVDASDLALTALVGATDDGNLVVLADGQSADLPSVRYTHSKHNPFPFFTVQFWVFCRSKGFRVGQAIVGKNGVHCTSHAVPC